MQIEGQSNQIDKRRTLHNLPTDTKADAIVKHAIANTPDESTRDHFVETSTIPVVTEIVPVERTDGPYDKLERALQACDQNCNGQSVFGSTNAVIYKGVGKAFSVYLLIKDDIVAHEIAIDDIMRVDPGRERKPSLKKPAYNAICRALHPQTQAEYDQCSEWSYILVWAAMVGIEDATFAECVQGKTLRGAKAAVRDAKRKASGKPTGMKKPAKLKPPFTDEDFPQLAQSFAIAGDPAWTAKLKSLFSELQSSVATIVAANDK